MTAHHRRHGGEVGRAAGRGVEDSRRLAEESRADDARSGNPDGLGIDITGVVEVMDGAAGDEDRFAGSDVHLLPRDRPGQRALEPVDRLVIAVVAVGGSDLRARGDVELEDSDRSPSTRNRIAISPTLISSRVVIVIVASFWISSGKVT
jgi:hypothetical protein